MLSTTGAVHRQAQACEAAQSHVGGAQLTGLAQLARSPQEHTANARCPSPQTPPPEPKMPAAQARSTGRVVACKGSIVTSNLSLLLLASLRPTRLFFRFEPQPHQQASRQQAITEGAPPGAQKQVAAGLVLLLQDLPCLDGYTDRHRPVRLRAKRVHTSSQGQPSRCEVLDTASAIPGMPAAHHQRGRTSRSTKNWRQGLSRCCRTCPVWMTNRAPSFFPGGPAAVRRRQVELLSRHSSGLTTSQPAKDDACRPRPRLPASRCARDGTTLGLPVRSGSRA